MPVRWICNRSVDRVPNFRGTSHVPLTGDLTRHSKQGRKTNVPAISTEVDMSNFSEIVTVYKTATSEAAKWSRIRDDLKTSIKEAMGDAKLALVDGVPVLKKTIVEQR